MKWNWKRNYRKDQWDNESGITGERARVRLQNMHRRIHQSLSVARKWWTDSGFLEYSFCHNQFGFTIIDIAKKFACENTDVHAPNQKFTVTCPPFVVFVDFGSHYHDAQTVKLSWISSRTVNCMCLDHNLFPLTNDSPTNTIRMDVTTMSQIIIELKQFAIAASCTYISFTFTLPHLISLAKNKQTIF